MVIELQVVQFWSEIILVILKSNSHCALVRFSYYFTCQVVIGHFVTGKFVLGQFNKPILFKVVV